VGHRVPSRASRLCPLSPRSRAWLLPEERKSSLLRACLGSVLHLPRHEDTQDRDAALYMEVLTGWALGTLPWHHHPGCPPAASRMQQGRPP